MEFNETLLTERVAEVKQLQAAEDEEKQQQPEPRPPRSMSLHCRECCTVLGDSFGVCGEMTSLDSVMCLRVTDDVVVCEETESARKGEMANCVFSRLRCRGCRGAVGRVIHSAPPRLAAIRSIFLLSKANISCYILDSSSMVEASAVTFDLRPLGENMEEVRWRFEAQFSEMTHVSNRLGMRKLQVNNKA